MAKPGPAPKPTNLKLVQGNPGKRPLPENEPKPEPIVKIPPPPAWLSKEGKEHFKSLAKRLLDINVLTVNDVENLAIWADAYATFIEAQGHIQKKGHIVGGVRSTQKSNPWITVSKDAWAKIKVLNAEFGLTPSARTRISTTLPPDGDGDDWDEF